MNSIRCRQCKHYIEAKAGEGKIYGCDRSKCVFESTTKNDSKFCPDRKAKTTNMETILHCIENECVAYKDGKCLKYNSDQEPTTKNCESCRYYGLHHEVCNYCYKCSLWTEGEPTTKNDLGVEEVTALAEWTEKLTKASEDAYNKGYADGMKAPQPRKGHWIGQKKIGFGEWKECIVPLKDGFVTDSCSCSECGDWLTGSDEYQCSGNFCPNCGADMREVKE